MNFNKKMYIAGRLCDGQGQIDVINPANNALVATVPAAGMDDAKCL
jgi:acyl-CoA reductase-like NAD-dependent aldehyde dehydrogenase